MRCAASEKRREGSDVQTQKSIVGGMTVLGVTGIICKLVGVLFSIPLTWLIGADGLSLFQLVFPTYNLLLTISSAGLPVAISRMVSHCLAKDDPRNARRVFKVALWLLTALGAVCTILMIVGNQFLAERVGEPQASLGYLAIAPCLILVCVLSASAGSCRGSRTWSPPPPPSSSSRWARLFVSLPLAYLGQKTGGIAYGAAGALLGITVVEALALVYMIILSLHKRDSLADYTQAPDAEIIPQSTLAKRMIRISIPITISACIVPLAQFVDSAMLLNRMIDSGLTREVARPLYGLFSGLVIRLINVPTALALAVAMTLCRPFPPPKPSATEKGNPPPKRPRPALCVPHWAALLCGHEPAFQEHHRFLLRRNPLRGAFASGQRAALRVQPDRGALYRGAGHLQHSAGHAQAAHPHVYAHRGRSMQDCAQLHAGRHAGH
jgi:hypothetical protein